MEGSARAAAGERGEKPLPAWSFYVNEGRWTINTKPLGIYPPADDIIALWMKCKKQEWGGEGVGVISIAW